MKVLNVNDDSFKRYGKVLKNYDFKNILNKMKNIWHYQVFIVSLPTDLYISY